MLSNVSFLITLEFKKGIAAINPIFVDIICLLMSHSLNLNLTIHLLIILRSYPYLKSYSYQLLRKSTVSSTYPLVVPPVLTYHQGQHLAVVPDDLYHALDPAPTTHLLPSSKPIALQNGIRSTRNVNPHFLSYHSL